LSSLKCHHWSASGSLLSAAGPGRSAMTVSLTSSCYRLASPSGIEPKNWLSCPGLSVRGPAVGFAARSKRLLGLPKGRQGRKRNLPKGSERPSANAISRWKMRVARPRSCRASCRNTRYPARSALCERLPSKMLATLPTRSRAHRRRGASFRSLAQSPRLTA
jgi:hypothetical protein